MKGYVFSYGVDGFGQDIAPAFEEGVYLNYEQAFRHLRELNKDLIEEYDFCAYEEGYDGEDYPPTNTILKKAEEEKDWETYDREYEKHRFRDVETVCKYIIDTGVPPFNLYCMHEIDIKN